jgi:hypothetical protein
MPDNEGNTALIIASQGGHSNLVTFLLESFKNEIDLNKRNVFGFTAVQKAALQGRLKCLKTLLAAGANTSLKDPNKGFSALEWANYCGRKSCAEAIRSHHKSTSSKNTKRLSQALNETEHWLKARLNSNANPTLTASGNSTTHGTTNRRPSKDEVSVNSILAKATGSSALLASLPILQNVTLPDQYSSSDPPKQHIIPIISITDFGT